jgi:hypothetical protein
MGREVHPAIREAVLGAAEGAGVTGLDTEGAVEGASEAGMAAAAAAGADIQVAAQAVVCAAVWTAVQQAGNVSAAVASAVTGLLSGASSSGLGPEETERAVYGAGQGLRAAAAATGQDRTAVSKALSDAVSLAAKAHGLPPGTLLAAAKSGMADRGPCTGCPTPQAVERPAAIPSEVPDPIEPVPDPTASPI